MIKWLWFGCVTALVVMLGLIGCAMSSTPAAAMRSCSVRIWNTAGIGLSLPPGFEVCEVINAPNVSICIYCHPNDPDGRRYLSRDCRPPFVAIDPEIVQSPPMEHTLPPEEHLFDDDCIDPANDVSVAVDLAEDAASLELSFPLIVGLPDPHDYAVNVQVSSCPRGAPCPTYAAPDTVITVAGSTLDVARYARDLGVVEIGFANEFGQWRIEADEWLPIARVYRDGRLIDVAMLVAER